MKMAAPKGNLFALGHGYGRPPKYDSPEEMGRKIDEYIKYCDDVKGKEGKGVYTLEGCALFLGFISVQSMYDYRDRSEDFSYVIHRFKLFMTDWNVQKLYWAGTTQGAVFWLKNKSDYKDEVIQQQNQTITQVNPVIKGSEAPLANNEKDVII